MTVADNNAQITSTRNDHPAPTFEDVEMTSDADPNLSSESTIMEVAITSSFALTLPNSVDYANRRQQYSHLLGTSDAMRHNERIATNFHHQIEDQGRPSTALEKSTGVPFGLEKDVKPPYTYAVLIGMAILSAIDRRASLHGIYQWISNHFRYYRTSASDWKNSVWHTLSRYEVFINQGGKPGPNGKGGYWTITTDVEVQFIDEIKWAMRDCESKSFVSTAGEFGVRTVKDMEEHLRRKYAESDQRGSYVCGECGNAYKRIGWLRQHALKAGHAMS